jgi:CRP-like cAMP-binding protein
MYSPNGSDDNRVLAGLGADDAGRLRARLRPVRLEYRQCLEGAHRPITTVYFPLRGLVSVVAISANRRHETEVGVIGCEGMTGLATVLGAKTSPFNTFVQMEGDGLCLGAGELIQLLDESTSLRFALLRYVNVFTVQMTETALASAKGNVVQRLARWLLLAHDRAAGDDLRLTHEFISVMLGVRRAGVTVALHELSARGLIAITRKSIAIKSRSGLEAICDGLYGMAERRSARSLGPEVRAQSEG